MGMMVACMALAGCNGTSSSKKPSRSASQSSSEEESSEPIVLPDLQVKIDNGDGNPKVETVKLGTALKKPVEDPTAPAGKVFYGWMNVKNGGEIWDFDSKSPDITERIGKDGTAGMDGETYSGGQSGTGLIGRVAYEDGKNKYNASGAYVRESGVARYATDADFANSDVSVVGAFVHYNYVKGNTLTWEIESDAAATNVTLFMRLSGEYGLTEEHQVFEGEGEARVYERFSDADFQVQVNNADVKYGNIAIHNIVPKDILPFRDFMISAEVSLNQGKNTIKMTVNNENTLNGTIKSTGPVIDAIKLVSSSAVTFSNAKLSQLNSSK